MSHVNQPVTTSGKSSTIVAATTHAFKTGSAITERVNDPCLALRARMRRLVGT